MRARKKSIEVNVFQMDKERRWDNSEWPNWLHIAWNSPMDCVGSLYCKNGGHQLFIRTLEGEQLVSWDDYIIQGVKGEIYPCKPDIFDLTYDIVDE